MSTIGIKEIGSYIPEIRESNHEKKDLFEVDENFIKTKIGVNFVSRRLPDQDTSDLCVKAFSNLQQKHAIDPTEIDCLVVVTQNPDGNGLPHTSAIVHDKLGCSDSCAAFDISLGCSGFVYALSIVKSFMECNGMRQGLLFTADPYSKIVDPGDRNTAILFGDAATVTLLTELPAFSPTTSLFSTRGNEGHNLACINSNLVMNGRAVFNFSATAVPTQISELLRKSKKSLEDIDILLLHQGSKYIVDTIQRKLDINPAKVPTNLESQGNTVSSSIPLLLQQYLNDRDIQTIVISGFGVGLSWASSLLERCN